MKLKIVVTVQRSEEPRRKEKTGYPYGLVGVLPRAELLQIELDIRTKIEYTP
jgi:hypothetical protein